MARTGLRHWMLHNGQLAKEYDETLKLSPGYDPVRDIDPALTFHAPLVTGTDSISGAIRAAFERNSEANYWAPRGAFLLAAADGESRHEYTPNDEPLGILLESASTNKCENYNANPDPALTALTPTGPGIIYRVNDAEELKAAGLDRLCSDGNVIAIDARGVGTTFCYVDAEVGNTNVHAVSAYCKAIEGSGFLGLSDGVSGENFSNRSWAQITTVQTPDLTTRRLTVFASSDSLVYFILNELEEQSVPSSVIVTEGAATSRAIEQLSWPLIDSQGRDILNQAEGMVAFIWVPRWTNTDTPIESTRNLVAVQASPTSFVYQSRFASANSILLFDDSGTDQANVSLNANDGPVAHGTYVIAARWSTGANEKQVGYKYNGAWIWSDVKAYTGAIPFDADLHLNWNPSMPNTNRDLRLWSQDRGIAWLESLFSGVAN